jgi:hypothetical protein
MPRGRTAIPITQPTNHRKKVPGPEHAKGNTRTELGDRSESLRYALSKRDYAAAERFWSRRCRDRERGRQSCLIHFHSMTIN